MTVRIRLPRRNGRRVDVPGERAIMPFVMRRRTDSEVYFEQHIDIAAAQDWIRRWNAAGGPQLSLFVLVLHQVAQLLHDRPRLNRFIARRRYYDRDGIYLSFGAKKAMTDDAPLEMLKRRFEPNEPLATTIRSLEAAVTEARVGHGADVDKEVDLFLTLPTPLLDVAISLSHWLAERGLLPGALSRSDPLYASAVVSNLGSLKTDAAFHHLYQHGDCPLFLVVGQVRPTPVAVAGTVQVRQMLTLRWTFDERIADGLYAARSAELLRSWLEDPFHRLGSPEEAVRHWRGATSAVAEA